MGPEPCVRGPPERTDHPDTTSREATLNWITEICRSPRFSRFEYAQLWSAALDAQFNAYPEYKAFRMAVHEWQEGEHAEIRLATDDVIAGRRRDARTERLLHVLAEADIEAPELFRGVALPVNADFKAEFGRGADIFPQLCSFTTSIEEAEYRAMGVSGGVRASVIFHLEAGGRAVPIENLSYRSDLWEEREWYTSGRFVGLGLDNRPDGIVWVRIRHEEIYYVG